MHKELADVPVPSFLMAQFMIRKEKHYGDVGVPSNVLQTHPRTLLLYNDEKFKPMQKIKRNLW